MRQRGPAGSGAGAVQFFSHRFFCKCKNSEVCLPQQFIEILNTTSVPAQTTIKGLELTFGKIPDPAAVIRELEDRVAR